MRLFHHPFSANSRRAVMAALHLEAPVELVFVDLARGEQHSPPLATLNPNHKVPVLEDGDLHLWESYAIMQYLADRTPGQTLYPEDLRARADVNRWLFWCSNHLSPAISTLNWENAVKRLIGRGEPDPAEVRRGEQLFMPLAGILDAHLATREWISGPVLTLADLAIAAPLGDATQARLPMGPHHNIQRWLTQVVALPVWERAAPQIINNN
jgi:glutathione S-transferase